MPHLDVLAKEAYRISNSGVALETVLKEIHPKNKDIRKAWDGIAKEVKLLALSAKHIGDCLSHNVAVRLCTQRLFYEARFSIDECREAYYLVHKTTKIFDAREAADKDSTTQQSTQSSPESILKSLLKEIRRPKTNILGIAWMLDNYRDLIDAPGVPDLINATRGVPDIKEDFIIDDSLEPADYMYYIDPLPCERTVSKIFPPCWRISSRIREKWCKESDKEFKDLFEEGEEIKFRLRGRYATSGASCQIVTTELQKGVGAVQLEHDLSREETTKRAFPLGAIRRRTQNEKPGSEDGVEGMMKRWTVF